MLRIAGPDEGATAADLSRLLHPSYGFPRRLLLALVPDGDALDPAAAGGAEPVDDLEVHLAEVVRLDEHPRFLAGRAPVHRPGR